MAPTCRILSIGSMVASRSCKTNAGTQAIMTPSQPPIAAKSPHIRASSGGRENELSLVTKLQNEKVRQKKSEMG